MIDIQPAVYTVAEVALLLNISEWMVYERVKRGEIPGAFLLGTKIRFKKAAVNDWLGIDPGTGPIDERAS